MVILVFVTLCGGCCVNSSGLGRHANDKSFSSSIGRRADDNSFSPREREVLSAAHTYLEQQYHKPFDGYYTIKNENDGYGVIVWVALGYDHGQPQFAPGSCAILELRKDLSVARFLPGY